MPPANQDSQHPTETGTRFVPHDAGNGAVAVDDREARPVDPELLLRLNRDLEERIRVLEDFSAMAAHELLKPLVLAEATAHGILERSASRLDLVSQDDLKLMMRASARVRLLVEGLLADGLQNGAALKRERIDLALVVQHCLELLAPEIEAKRARVRVEPMPMVVGDGALLNGAIGNLLANALKYGPRSNAEIRIAVERGDGGWVFSVDSPGRPLSERDRTVIFDPWRRGFNERRARGAGLGLAIVRRIVERHGGEVGVQSLNGHGNRFFFTLPAG
jgi:signal transduction histidine kinase